MSSNNKNSNDNNNSNTINQCVFKSDKFKYYRYRGCWHC